MKLKLSVFVSTALMEAIGLRVVSVTKSTVTVMWAWQQKSEPIRVKRYRVVLRRDSDTQSRISSETSISLNHRKSCKNATLTSLSLEAVSLWPDQLQHTFFNLTPDTEYSVLLQADNVSRSIVTVSTYFGESRWSRQQIKESVQVVLFLWSEAEKMKCLSRRGSSCGDGDSSPAAGRHHGDHLHPVQDCVRSCSHCCLRFICGTTSLNKLLVISVYSQQRESFQFSSQ